jgi:hypothetical protein
MCKIVWKLTGSTLLALLVTLPIFFSSTTASPQPATRTILLKLDVNLKDPALEFVLDEREIPAKMLQAPMKLQQGHHELVVLQNSEPLVMHRFEVGPNTGAEIVLKRMEPPPGDDEADFRPALAANVKPTVAPKPPAPTRADLRQHGDWVPLFNGKDLAGWKVRAKNPGSWRVDNGILTCDGGRYGHLFTEENDWTDLHLRVEAKSKGPNTGVCLRAPFDVTPADQSYQADLGGVKKRPSGSLTIAGRDTDLVNTQVVPPDTWFTLEVIIRGHHIVTKINGKVMVDYEDKKKTYAKGHIVMRHPADKSSIQFKRVEVRDLAPKKAIAKSEPKPDPKVAHNGRYSVHTIPLPDTLAPKPNPPRLMIAPMPGGGFRLGWNDGKGHTHLTPLREDLQPAVPTSFCRTWSCAG